MSDKSEVLDLYQYDKEKHHSRLYTEIERRVYLDRLERMYQEITERQKEIIEKESFTFEKLQLLEKCLELHFLERQIDEVINPELDFHQMQMVMVGLGYESAGDEIEPAVNIFLEQGGTSGEEASMHTVVKDVKHTVITQKFKKENIR